MTMSTTGRALPRFFGGAMTPRVEVCVLMARDARTGATSEVLNSFS